MAEFLPLITYLLLLLSKSTRNYPNTSLNPQTRNQATQTRNQSKQPRRQRPRSNTRHQANNFFNNPPPWRDRLRSSSNSSQDPPHFCPCPKCDPFRSRGQHPADGNSHRATYPTLFLPLHLTIGRSVFSLQRIY